MIYVTQSLEGHIFVAVALQDTGQLTRSLELATGASGNIPQRQAMWQLISVDLIKKHDDAQEECTSDSSPWCKNGSMSAFANGKQLVFTRDRRTKSQKTMKKTPGLQILMTGIAFGESPRWHDDRLWFSDWGAQQVIAVDLEGKSEVIVHVQFPSFPMCIDFLPNGHLLVVSARDGLLLCMEPDGSLVTYADLTGLSDHPWNEIVVDGRGNAYINNVGFDFPGGEFAPGIIALVTPDGSARRVADGVAFPNGMVLTPDNSTLIVAESYGKKLTAFDIAADGSLSNRRVWADLAGGVPDGICLDAENAIWYGDVPNKRCVRVRED